MLRYVHNTQHEENKEEENPLTTHYTREKTYEKDDEKGTQVRSVRIVQREGGRVKFFLCLYIYTTIIVCFFSNKNNI